MLLPVARNTAHPCTPPRQSPAIIPTKTIILVAKHFIVFIPFCAWLCCISRLEVFFAFLLNDYESRPPKFRVTNQRKSSVSTRTSLGLCTTSYPSFPLRVALLLRSSLARRRLFSRQSLSPLLLINRYHVPWCTDRDH